MRPATRPARRSSSPAQFITRREAPRNLLLAAKDQHKAAIMEMEIFQIKQRYQFNRLKNILDIVEGTTIRDAEGENEEVYYTLWNLLHLSAGQKRDHTALEQRKPAGCPANGSTSKKTQKLDSITESHQECDTNNEHSPMGMKEVKEVTSKTESGERGVVCGTDEKATTRDVAVTLVMPSPSPAPCMCTSGRWRPTSPT